ncbi:hypothetical protein GE21DRAFT_1017852 [Neurospora crassa]|nr:hypothetical protein GE21DRAFT_1017852 [Neurospora crassa]
MPQTSPGFFPPQRLPTVRSFLPFHLTFSPSGANPRSSIASHSCPLPIYASDLANRILGTCLLPLSGQVQPTCRIPHPKTFPQKSVSPINPSVPHLRLSSPHSPVSPSHPPPPYELASEGVRILSHCGRRHWYLKSL